MTINNKSQTETKKTLPKILLRAGLGLCPNCGIGRLFASYLNQVKCCSLCGEDYDKIQADDGPTWLTLLLVCHIIVPVLLYGLPYLTGPDYISMLIIIVPAIMLTLLLLPHVKGIFIGVLWHLNCKDLKK